MNIHKLESTESLKPSLRICAFHETSLLRTDCCKQYLGKIQDLTGREFPLMLVFDRGPVKEEKYCLDNVY